MHVFLCDLCTLAQNVCASLYDIRIHQRRIMPLIAPFLGGKWDTPAWGQVLRLIAINSPSMQLHFHLHAPVKWACLTWYQQGSQCVSFPSLRSNKASRGIRLQGGRGGEGLGFLLLFNIFIEKAARIINYIPIVPFSPRLTAARFRNNIQNTSKHKKEGNTVIWIGNEHPLW